MKHHRFPIRASLFLFLLAALPLYGEDPAPAETQPAPEQKPGTEPQTSSAPAQTAPNQQGQASQLLGKSSPANDAARYLAGLPVMPGSSIAALAQEPGWQAHARAMNQAFAQLEQRQLSNIRVFRAENIAPVTQQSHTCVYLFSGPDFLYADAMFSDCSTFVLQGL
jgi:hypothetical protein